MPWYWNRSTVNSPARLFSIPHSSGPFSSATTLSHPSYPGVDYIIARGIAMMLGSVQKQPIGTHHLHRHHLPSTYFASSVHNGMRDREPTALRRAVFSEIQRQGLESAFQRQAYITKIERKVLAESLGLKDAQVECISCSNKLINERLTSLIQLTLKSFFAK